MNEINTLTLEIMQNTGICDIETAQEIAELVINKLDYHKEQPKISPMALILAQDLQKVITSCDYDCATCRYGEFREVDISPNCLSVKTAEALIALGWTKEISHNEGVNDMKRYTEVCGDNRFELIKKYKERLVAATNIETAIDEMNVIDSILFRFWQMGWLDRLEADVVPKSDVEHYIKIMFEAELIKAKQEFAKQIFEEIKKTIEKHYNRHIFGVEELSEVEQEAVMNFCVL